MYTHIAQHVGKLEILVDDTTKVGVLITCVPPRFVVDSIQLFITIMESIS